MMGAGRAIVRSALHPARRTWHVNIKGLVGGVVHRLCGVEEQLLRGVGAVDAVEKRHHLRARPECEGDGHSQAA